MMLTAFIQINTKELFRGVFDVAGSLIWALRWYLAAILVVVLLMAFMERLFEIRKFRKIIIFILFLVLIGFFIWIYT